MRTTVLLHTLPDGSSHFDWLLERDADGLLITFRVRVPPHHPEPAAFNAEHAPDHRRRYLDYEGPISGGRGEVRRVARGRMTPIALTDHRIEAEIDFGSGPVRFTGRRVGGTTWRFERRPA